MKALAFEAKINPDQTLSVPPAVASEVPSGQAVRVLLLLPDSTEEEEWERMASSEFLQGYADCDAIYDQLSGR